MSSEQIMFFLQSLGFFGPFAYILIVFICTVISPLGSVFLWPFVLLAWGFPLAAIYTSLGAIGGATANFWIARKFGRPIIEKLITKKGMEIVDKISLKEGLKTLLFLRLFPSGLFDYISYTAGLTRIHFLPYFLITSFYSFFWNLVIFRFMDFFLGLIRRGWYVIFGYLLIPITFLMVYFNFRKNEDKHSS